MTRAAHLDEAAEHAKRGRWAKAIESYRVVLAEEPDNAELRVVLADAYRRTKNDERAFHHYHRAAMLLLSKGDAARAAAALLEANAITPNTPDVLWRLCEALKALGRGDDLVPYLVALIRAAGAPGDRRRLWALEELFLLHPDDLSVAQQRAEALAEADRVDEAVLAYKRLAARLGQREAELVQVLFRAAKIAEGRADLGADLAGVLLAHGRPKDALAVIVGFYEKQPDDVAVLETLVRTLEALGAAEKAVAARIELVKTRAAQGARAQVAAEIDALWAVAPEDPVALEVSAHALALVREPARAQDAWRRLLRVAERRGLRAERDRAIAAVLKANPDDEEALELGIQMHAGAARFQEADSLRQRLGAVRALKRRSLVPAPATLSPAPLPKRTSTPPESAPMLGSAGLPDDPELTGTMVLSDSDVVGVRGAERAPREHDPVPERSDPTPRLGVRPTPRDETVRPGARGRAHDEAGARAPTDGPVPSPNPWFEGREQRAPSTLGDARPSSRAPTPTARPPGRTSPTDTVERAQAQDPASYGARRGGVAARTSTMGSVEIDVDETWDGDEPTTMDTRAVAQLRALTDAVLIADLQPSLPGELTHPGLETRPLGPGVGLVDDLLDEP